MTDSPLCKHCTHYRVKYILTPEAINWQKRPYCAKDWKRELVPCDDFLREIGADDE